MRQRVEIVKALMRSADLLVLDEPTSILSPPEVEGLIGVMRKLKADGRAIIFITHKLGEVLSVCDEVVVLRDGKVSGRTPVAGATREGLAHMMVGRTLAEPPQRANRAPGPERLVARGVSARDACRAGAACRMRASACAAAKSSRSLASTATDRQELCDTLAGLSPALTGTDHPRRHRCDPLELERAPRGRTRLHSGGPQRHQPRAEHEHRGQSRAA